MAIDAAAARAVATEYLARHQAKDSAGVAALFAEDAKVWDPVDSEPHVGRAVVEAFFTGTHQMAERMEFKLTGDVRVAGNHIAFDFRSSPTCPTWRSACRSSTRCCSPTMGSSRKCAPTGTSW